MTTALGEFVGIMVSAVTDLGEGIAAGVAAMAQALFLKVNASTGAVEGLSIFGGIVGIFAGLAKLLGKYKSRNIGEGFNTNTEITYNIA